MPRRRGAVEDRDGQPVRPGDIVRVVGIPDLAGMSAAARRESLAVFRYLVGRYRRVAGFNALGLAELAFRIRDGRRRGLHTVWIEPSLLKVRRRRRPNARPAGAPRQ